MDGNSGTVRPTDHAASVDGGTDTQTLSEHCSSFSSRLVQLIQSLLARPHPRSAWSEYCEKMTNGLTQLIEMFKEDCKRPIEQSLIHLNHHVDQRLGHAEADLLMHLIRLRRQVMMNEEINQSTLGREMDEIVFDRIMQLLPFQQPDTDDRNDEKQPPRYDVCWRDKCGMTALHALCTCPMAEGSVMYRLAERLLQLGMDPNMPHCASPPIFSLLSEGALKNAAAIKLMLDHGYDMSTQSKTSGVTCMHWLVEYADLDFMRHLYRHFPRHLSAFDYSLTTNDGKTVTELATSKLAQPSMNATIQQMLRDMIQLLIEEREKQYSTIRSLLHMHTPLRLNNANDVSTIVFAYIAAHDYDYPSADTGSAD